MALLAGFAGGSFAEVENKDDAVFLDEGDGDFDPVPSLESPKAKAEVKAEVKADSPSTEKASDKIAEPAKTAAPEVQPDSKAESAPVERAGHNPKVGKKAPAVREKELAKGDAGIYVTTKAVCPIRREPAGESEVIAKTKVPRKLWVQKVDEKWVRAYVKSGDPGYISTDCFEK